MNDPGVLIVGALVRVIEAAAAAAPTILVGLLLAGVMRRWLKADGTKRVFGGDSWRGVIQAWGLGMLIPVCSFGVIPMLREMQRSGLARGTIMAFALAAPLFNPLSVLYGLSLSRPLVVLSFAFCSLLLVTMVGEIWGRIFPEGERVAPVDRPVAHGLRRMAAVLVVGCQEAAGATLAYFAIGLAAVGLMAIVLPFGCLQFTMRHEDPLSPLLMAPVAIPAYVTPLAVMGQIGGMFEHGNSIGAALVLLCLGAGVNVGMAAWMIRGYGVKATLGWFALATTVVVAMAYAIEKPLFYSAREPEGHTHAFDVYTAPFVPGTADVLKLARQHVEHHVTPDGWYSLAILGGFCVIGVALRTLKARGWDVDEWLERTPESETARYDLVLPDWALGVASLAGLIAFSVLGCYVYYPSPKEIFTDLGNIKTETVYYAKRLDLEQAKRFIGYWDDLSRRLEIGATIRGANVTPEMQETGSRVRYWLDELRHAVEHATGAPSADEPPGAHGSLGAAEHDHDHDVDDWHAELDETVDSLLEAHAACRDAYRSVGLIE